MSRQKKELDNILRDIRKECYKRIDESSFDINVMELLLELVSSMKPETKKIMQGHGFVMLSQVEFEIGDGQSVPLSTRVTHEDEN